MKCRNGIFVRCNTRQEKRVSIEFERPESNENVYYIYRKSFLVKLRIQTIDHVSGFIRMCNSDSQF